MLGFGGEIPGNTTAAARAWAGLPERIAVDGARRSIAAGGASCAAERTHRPARLARQAHKETRDVPAGGILAWTSEPAACSGAYSAHAVTSRYVIVCLSAIGSHGFFVVSCAEATASKFQPTFDTSMEDLSSIVSLTRLENTFSNSKSGVKSFRRPAGMKTSPSIQSVCAKCGMKMLFY